MVIAICFTACFVATIICATVCYVYYTTYHNNDYYSACQCLDDVITLLDKEYYKHVDKYEKAKDEDKPYYIDATITLETIDNVSRMIKSYMGE